MIDTFAQLLQMGKNNVQEVLNGDGYILFDVPVHVDEDDLAGFLLVEELFARCNYDIAALLGNLSDLMCWVPMTMALGYASLEQDDFAMFAQSDKYTSVAEAQAIVGSESLQDVYNALRAGDWWVHAYVKVLEAVEALLSNEEEEE